MIPVSKINVKGSLMDKKKIGDKDVGYCCRVVSDPLLDDNTVVPLVQCKLEVEEGGGEGLVTLSQPVSDTSKYIQMALGLKTGKPTKGGGRCPKNWVVIAKASPLSFTTLWENDEYRAMMIGGGACVVLIICWCYQQQQKKAMIGMIVGQGQGTRARK